LGKDWQNGQDFNQPPGWDAGFEYSGGGYTGADTSAFSDFFEDLFGSAAQGGQQGGFHRPGEDHHARILIDLVDAYKGSKREISLQVPVVDASGHVNVTTRTLSVNIPKGVKEGQRIRLAGQGSAGTGQGKQGDLYLEIQFKPDPRYRVEGKDVYLELPLAPWEAALGAKITVPLPDGKIDMKIPPDSSNGSKMRLKGKGIPAKEAGDFYVVLSLVLPSADTDQARDFYRNMEKEMGFNPRQGLGV